MRASKRWSIPAARVGLLNPVIADVAVSVVPKQQSGMAAGINDTFARSASPSASPSGARSSSAAAPTRSPSSPRVLRRKR